MFITDRKRIAIASGHLEISVKRSITPLERCRLIKVIANEASDPTISYTQAM